ncbi:MAG: phosphoenolpyruvate--protein phosphotransferase [Acidobacteria bacterium]|nr:MAG: phosphoenolpyruvate--protein phosphotransferase [Acidobacteriota bacterium]
METRIQGRAVSRGIAFGKIVCVFGNRRHFVRRTIDESDLETEMAGVKAALESARASLRSDIQKTLSRQKSSTSEILESHLLILGDPTLESRIVNRIDGDRINAESAILSVFDEISSGFRSSTEDSLREKALDIDDVCERLLDAFGPEQVELTFPANTIVAAKEIKPSTLLEFAESGVSGFIAELGGWTSHTSILARESQIPAITGISKIGTKFFDGQTVIVNGYSGEIILDAEEKTIETYRSLRPSDIRHAPASEKQVHGSKTLDGREIVIRTNATTVESYETAASNGALGIGLFRSESLISKFKRIPTEEEQMLFYVELANAVGNAGIRVRTFDIDADQYIDPSASRQRNPALGLRAIRLGLLNRDLLEPQLRAIIQASYEHDIGIIIPMVSGVAEIDAVRKLISEVTVRLENEQVSFGSPSVGAMIEIPSAVLVVDQIVATVDFLCLGTNDLAQYLLAADRDNEAVSRWFQTLHPAMLRAVRRVVEVCRAAGKPLIVCGEMAGSPFYAPVLIGLGATELSMNPGSVEAVRKVIGGIALEEAAELVQKLETMSTAEEIEDAVSVTAREKWPHLFADGFLDNRNS